ncbi:divalent-cation tolerance protein CutA [Roseiconus lacunae]|uniref:divalent-cation tolerance protein CutA n=1 Tax=Roseiconus lacunae TaxID=2605694 RepID=UPI001E3910E1|nr:divalent-cation tolerance protein CutA [Roseiconus lacunae]MCD0460972.1 divalent-cation tolerance protein CutA [Roseiconus lacunae]
MDHAPALVVCLTTVSDEKQAEALARTLLQERVAACVQVDSPIRSFYCWDGKDCVDRELRLVIKTTRERATALQQTILRCHPYDQPQVVILDCSGADPGYAHWVGENTTED